MAKARLEKHLSPINVWALALGCIIGWGAFVMPADIFLPNGGPLGTLIAMGIVSIIMSVIVINYHYMIQMFPLSGGEFVYSSKAFGRLNGFICAWFLGLSYLAIVPLNATALALVGRNLLSDIFAIGYLYTVVGYDIYLGEILLALGVLILVAILNIRGVKCAGVFQTGLVFLLIGGILTITLAAVMNPNISFLHLRPVFYPGETKMVGVLAIIAVAPWAFVGFDTVPQTTEEFNFSPHKTRQIMVASIIFGAFIYALLNAITAVCVPEGYPTWVEYIENVDYASGLMALPTFYAAYQLLGYPGVFFLGLAVVAAILSGIIGFYVATSRLLYAMALEKVLPRWFGVLDKRYKTPKNAIIFTLVLASIAPFFGRTVLKWIVDMSSLGAAIGYGYTSAAAFYFASKAHCRQPWIKATSFLGILFAIVFAALLLIPNEKTNCCLSEASFIALIVWCVMGAVFYCSSTLLNGTSDPY